ncbi:MAG: metal ABC transporter substrate-binding protein [Acidimicrobiales bacterium]|nr:metal ABC transporter substrate-binding protein [Acidimicrobiales bacterium]
MVVTTTALGDVVENVVGEEADVVTLIPLGADPHDFQASAQQANQIREADALVVNGAGLEEGLLDVIESAEDDGVPTFEAISAVATIGFGEGGHAHDDEHSEEDHAEEDHAEDDHAEDDHSAGDEHVHEGADPHFFLDPARMAVVADAIGDFLTTTVDGIDAGALDVATSGYVNELEHLDAEIEESLSEIEDERRVLVTNHDALGYFAERYDFEVIGTVIPSGSTADGSSAGTLADLAETVRDQGVPAVFADNSASDDLARTLADEVGDDIAVVELFTGSLGEQGSEAATYVEMIRTNAERIAGALA